MYQPLIEECEMEDHKTEWVHDCDQGDDETGEGFKLSCPFCNETFIDYDDDFMGGGCDHVAFYLDTEGEVWATKAILRFLDLNPTRPGTPNERLASYIKNNYDNEMMEFAQSINIKGAMVLYVECDSNDLFYCVVPNLITDETNLWE
jgi:hypothetical protein